MKRAQVEQILEQLAPLEREFETVSSWLYKIPFEDDFDSNELLNRYNRAHNALRAVKNYLTTDIEGRN
jgi:hypothetical protein